MSCFIGLSIQQSLDPQIYQLALSEIQDFIEQSSFKIIPHDSLIIISNRYQKFYITKNPDFLHSNLQHFLVSQAQDQQFIQTIVQCLMILKEHFPHKIQIQMVSDLQQIFNLKLKIDQQIPRRLSNHLKILHEQAKKVGLNEQQIHMLIKNITAEFHKDYKQKIKSFSLKILSQAKVDPKIWNQLPKNLIKIIDDVANDPSYQKIGIEILQKIVRNNDYKVFPFDTQKQNEQPNSFRNELSEDQKFPDFEGPLQPSTALFQLKQSVNICRLAWIIDNVECQKLDSKKLKKFDIKIRQVAQKFLNGFYPDVPLLHLKYFGRALSEYEMRRGNLSWGELVEEVLIKLEEIGKYSIKRSRREKNV